jgi:hypothetical protein
MPTDTEFGEVKTKSADRVSVVCCIPQWRRAARIIHWRKNSASNMLNKKSIKVPQNERRKAGWQAKKSAMTRQAILEAAIQCIIDHGYAQTTTWLIADRAAVSRGAMTHHFPSRSDVLTATIKYLHERRLQEYRALVQEFDINSKLTAENRSKRSWKWPGNLQRSPRR